MKSIFKPVKNFFSQNMDAPFAGRVIMVSKEQHVPYDRPILSKVSVKLVYIFAKKLLTFWSYCSV